MTTEDLEYVKNNRGCVFCAGFHDLVPGLEDFYQPCPRVKRICRTEAGAILELEFWPNGHWENRVVFPSEMYEESD